MKQDEFYCENFACIMRIGDPRAPQWFHYDDSGWLDLVKTLFYLPENMDDTHIFSRTEINFSSEHEKQVALLTRTIESKKEKITETQYKLLRCLLWEYSIATAILSGLVTCSPQKRFLRSLAEWLSCDIQEILSCSNAKTNKDLL